MQLTPFAAGGSPGHPRFARDPLRRATRVVRAAETAADRGSAPFPEIIAVTVGAGAGLGLLIGAGIALARRLARDSRKRG